MCSFWQKTSQNFSVRLFYFALMKCGHFKLTCKLLILMTKQDNYLLRPQARSKRKDSSAGKKMKWGCRMKVGKIGAILIHLSSRIRFFMFLWSKMEVFLSCIPFNQRWCSSTRENDWPVGIIIHISISSSPNIDSVKFTNRSRALTVIDLVSS